MKTKKQFKVGDHVQTPEGPGIIKEESEFGEFRIKMDGARGDRWYFEEDLELFPHPGAFGI